MPSHAKATCLTCSEIAVFCGAILVNDHGEYACKISGVSCWTITPTSCPHGAPPPPLPPSSSTSSGSYLSHHRCFLPLERPRSPPPPLHLHPPLSPPTHQRDFSSHFTCQVEDFLPCVNTLLRLSLVGAAALDAVDQFHKGNLQVTRASHHTPHATTPSLPACPALTPLPQDLINILNENASALGLQLRRFKGPAPFTFIRPAAFDLLSPGPTDGALYVGLHSSQGQSRPVLRGTHTAAIFMLLFSSNLSSLLSAKVNPPPPSAPPPLPRVPALSRLFVG